MTVDELKEGSQFECWLELKHEEILPFVQEEFSQRSPLIRFYIYLNIFLLLFLLLLGAWQSRQGVATAGHMIQYCFLGMALALTLLVPVHEGIHGLAYKLIGAPKVEFGSDIRKFIFYAMADHFVMNWRHFQFVALSPFVVINFFALLAMFFILLAADFCFLPALLFFFPLMSSLASFMSCFASSGSEP